MTLRAESLLVSCPQEEPGTSNSSGWAQGSSLCKVRAPKAGWAEGHEHPFLGPGMNLGPTLRDAITAWRHFRRLTHCSLQRWATCNLSAISRLYFGCLMRRLEGFSVFLSKTPHEGQVVKSCECKGQMMAQDTHPPHHCKVFHVKLWRHLRIVAVNPWLKHLCQKHYKNMPDTKSILFNLCQNDH